MTRSQLLPRGTRVRVDVPASTSNLGPGFDAFGCALGLVNSFVFELGPPRVPPRFEFGGTDAAGLPCDGSNLAIRAMEHAWSAFGEDPGVASRVSLSGTIRVPQARGLGSSSTAIVAGVAAACALLRRPPSVARQLELATDLEGHPDNVSAALLGGLVASVPGTRPVICRRFKVHRNVAFVVAVPNYEVRTSDARAALPVSYPRQDVIANLSRTPLILDAFRSGDLSDLWTLMEDRVHQPYRARLYPGMEELRAAAQRNGAAGFCVSGAGPSMLAIAARGASGKVSSGLTRALAALPFGGRVLELPARFAGARVRVIAPKRG